MRARQQRLSSEQILKLLEKCSSSELSAKIKECLILRLIELGFLKEPKPYEELVNEGPEGKVKQFLRKIDAWHYADSQLSPTELVRETHVLYQEISQ